MFKSSLLRISSIPLRLNSFHSYKLIPKHYYATLKKYDLIDEILNDHREFEGYYDKYKAAESIAEGHKWFNLFVWGNCRHAVAEEVVVFPLVEAQGDRGKQYVEESLEGHRKVKLMFEDLLKEKDEDKFAAKFDAVYQELREHHKSEETQDLPFIKEKVSQEKQETAAKAFVLGKSIAPTRPHSDIPDRSVAIELALGLLVMPIDKLRDCFTPFPENEKGR